jgi:carbon-monoxide dehydrogenase large subunit
MAEGSSVAAPAAIFNAVADALAPFGARVGELPLSPRSVWDSLQAARLASV